MLNTHPSLKKLPDTPGVYLFLGRKRAVLYIGKATSLRDRVRSYFSADLPTTRGPQIVRMVDDALRVEFRTTDSVLEALILEANLIKSLKPRANTDGKDDKSWNYLVITTNETYPRLLTVRGRELELTLEEHERGYRLKVIGDREHASKTLRNERGTADDLTSCRTLNSKLQTPNSLPVYGPFVHAGQFKEALKVVRRIFPYYDTTRPVDELIERNDKKLRFNSAIGVYPPLGVTPEEYSRTIRHLRLFFDGKKKALVAMLAREMKAFARAQRFEEATIRKKQIFALKHIRDVSLLRREPSTEGSDAHIRIEAYDVAHLAGDAMVGVMTVVEGGEAVKTEYRSFNIRSVTSSNDTAALREVLERRLAHPEWAYPKLVVVDGGTAQLNVARKVLTEAGVEIPIVAVVKDERHRPREVRGPVAARKGREHLILLANSEAHRFSLRLHKQKRARSLRT